MENPKAITIGVAAKKVGISVETIRYYQSIGLIDEPEKPVFGYRIYPDEMLLRLNFIKQSKQLGFSLGEIASLLALDNTDCSQVKAIAEKKLASVNEKIQSLQSTSSVLEKLLSGCKNNTKSQSICPIIEIALKK